MKYLLSLIIFTFLISCGSSKSTSKKEPVSKIENINNESLKTEESNQERTQIEGEIIPDTLSTKKITQEIPVIEITEAFNHNSWNFLLQKHVSIKGNVNYKTLKTDRISLSNYITSLANNMPLDSWTKEDKLAYWINAYNALTIDLILRNYPLKSIKNIKDPWEQRLWKLGKKWYNLNNIEHQILRKMDEPRVHFAIVCASISCPKLLNEAYSAENLKQQLTKATKDFLSDTSRNSISEDKLELSKIFKWFDSDFTKNGSLIDFLNLYSNIEISKKATKSYKDYNWDLNE